MIEDAYAQATSDAERAALEDGRVSDLEYAYFQGKIVECLTAAGVTDARFGRDNHLTYTNPEFRVPQQVITACNSDNGIRVLALRDSMIRNPHHLDENEIMVACLIRTGAVPASYTADDLRDGRDLDSFIRTSAFSGCAESPLTFGAH